MKKRDFDAIKNKSTSELITHVNKITHDLQQAIIDFNLGKIKNVHALNTKRKGIAKIKTVLADKIYLAEKAVEQKPKRKNGTS